MQDRPRIVPKNKTWDQLNKDKGIGVLRRGCEYELTDRDYRWISSELDRNIKNTDNVKTGATTLNNRIDSAAMYRNEKMLKKGVFEDILYFATNQDPVFSDCIKPCFFGVAIQDIEIQNIKKIIVVENGTMITHANSWRQLLPEEWRESLITYRGHAKNNKALQQLLHCLPKSAHLAVFSDFDPYGIIIADHLLKHAQQASVSIIVPSCYQDKNWWLEDNQKTLFSKQSSRRATIKNKKLEGLYKYILENKIAVTQENFVRYKSLDIINVLTTVGQNKTQ